MENLADVELSVGPMWASDTWSDKNKGNSVWYSPFLVLDFQAGLVEIDENRLFEQTPFKETVDILKEWSRRIEQEYQQLHDFFRRDGYQDRIAELAEFQDRRRLLIRKALASRLIKKKRG
jgi:hypothetical protein